MAVLWVDTWNIVRVLKSLLRCFMNIPGGDGDGDDDDDDDC
jgi:hypothetical protein